MGRGTDRPTRRRRFTLQKYLLEILNEKNIIGPLISGSCPGVAHSQILLKIELLFDHRSAFLGDNHFA